MAAILCLPVVDRSWVWHRRRHLVKQLVRAARAVLLREVGRRAAVDARLMACLGVGVDQRGQRGPHLCVTQLADGVVQREEAHRIGCARLVAHGRGEELDAHYQDEPAVLPKPARARAVHELVQRAVARPCAQQHAQPVA